MRHMMGRRINRFEKEIWMRWKRDPNKKGTDRKGWPTKLTEKFEEICMKRYRDRKEGSRNSINKLEQEMWSRNLINNFDLISSDQIRSNDHVRSDQRSDRTGNSTKLDGNSNQADQSVIGKMDHEIWSRNRSQKCDQEIWLRISFWWDPIRSDRRIKQVRSAIRSETNSTNFDQIFVEIWSDFHCISIDFRSNLDRLWIERGAIWNKIWIDIWSNLGIEMSIEI